MITYFDKSLLQQVFNSNEFKGWLLSRRWFADKFMLNNLAFNVSISYFEILLDRILLTITEIKTGEYSKSYFLPLIYYEKIQDILEPKEKKSDNIVKLTENTYSKMVVLSVHDKQEDIAFSLNLVEAEYCAFFWKKILFDKKISEIFPSLSLDLTLHTEQFEDEVNMLKVQQLIEAGLYKDRYEFSLKQLGGGNTTNLIFLLSIYNIKTPNLKPTSYVLKSYKEYSERLEPKTLYVLVKNKFPYAPKIYGTIKIRGKETIGILENVSNVGNLGDIYWNELNKMIYDIFQNVNNDYAYLGNREQVNNLIGKYCQETLIVSEKIGIQIKYLHDALILEGNEQYSKEVVNSEDYLKGYTEKLNQMISELQKNMSKKPESAFFKSPKIISILIDIKDIIEKFRSEFDTPNIKIQPVHQDLHMQQILYDRENGNYKFYFIDFEGDPQLSIEEKKLKFPIEKDLGSFLRSLSYIKFNTLLNFIEKKIIDKEKYEVPEEFLFSIYFRKAAKISNKLKTLEIVLNVLNIWENRLMRKIFDKSLKLHFTLINYFTIERALHELDYELLFRPNKIIVPILGLKEILDKY